MKEYRVRFTNLPGGPDDPAIFIELEDETGKSLGGLGTPYVWIKDEGDSVVLILPTYEEHYRIALRALSNSLNILQFDLPPPSATLKSITKEIKEALDELIKLQRLI